MKTARTLLVAAALVLALVPAAHAQVKGVEIGATLVNLTVNSSGGSTNTAFGIPSGAFGFSNPSVFMSIFVAPKIAIEPQLGLVIFSAGGSTEHFVTFATQVDYFFNGSTKNSPYVFGDIGLVSFSGLGSTPATFGGGAGYRMRFGERLTMRFEGKVTHITQGGGNSVAFGVSLGGLFHEK